LPQTGIPNEILPAISAINGGLDRLDEGFRRQREFCANVAHQLRTPLAVLSANLDLMTDKAVAEKLRPDVDLMIRMVTQLLLISKLESLNIPLDHKIELRACAQEAAAKLGPVAVAMGKSLEVVEPDAPVHLHGNAPILISGISNLIENALKHSPPGSTVRIWVTSSPSIEVHDTGPGVPPSMQERIFERFWQGNDSQHGAGLGLSIVRQIMQALHGTVSVSQSPEGGAQFTLHFPQGKTVVQPPAPRNQGCVPAEPLLS
jgi:signal transduction histidine kinase